jgi:hypothetical protein
VSNIDQQRHDVFDDHREDGLARYSEQLYTPSHQECDAVLLQLGMQTFTSAL